MSAGVARAISSRSFECSNSYFSPARITNVRPSRADQMQDRCVALYTAAGDADSLKYAVSHRDIIARFVALGLGMPEQAPVLPAPLNQEELQLKTA